MSGLLAWFEKVQVLIQTVGYSILTICVILLAILLGTSGGKPAEGAKKWAINILSALAVLSFGVSIIATLRG